MSVADRRPDSPRVAPRRRSLAAPSLALVAIVAFGTAARAPAGAFTASDSVTLVSTFAGSGTSGNLDGPAASATFSTPAGLAVAPNGDVYVVDRALNTIRLIRNGTVSTVVGNPAGDPVWRPGGYRDGPAAQALLNHAEAIAVAPDGSLVIGDSWNSCLRRLRDGIVTTIVGSPSRFGYVDGPIATAKFKNPLAVAVDARGTIFVSDHDDPIRRIDPDGTVSSFTVDRKGLVFGLATAPPDKLFIADEGGLIETNTVPGAAEVRLTNSSGVRETPTVEAGAPLGHPFAVAAVDGHTVAYADLTDDSIRLAVATRVERIAGAPVADQNEAGGFRDGPALEARFNAPDAIARYGNGWLVADSGNHRIRYVSGVDTRNAVGPNAFSELFGYLDRRRPQLVVIGNAEAWFDTNYANSIAGRLQPLLPTYDVIPVSLVDVDDPASAGAWLAHGYGLPAGSTVVYVFNDAGITHHGRTSYADLLADRSWATSLGGSFAELRGTCANANLTVVDIPIGLEASPSESAFAQRLFDSTSSEWERIDALHAIVAATARTSGVRYVDLWPAFRALDAQGRGPLYHPFDSHLSALGRAHLAESLAGIVAR